MNLFVASSGFVVVDGVQNISLDYFHLNCDIIPLCFPNYFTQQQHSDVWKIGITQAVGLTTKTYIISSLAEYPYGITRQMCMCETETENP